MELIERYLREIGRHLPANKRTDILSELRAALNDSLGSQDAGLPTEERVVPVIVETALGLYRLIHFAMDDNIPPGTFIASGMR